MNSTKTIIVNFVTSINTSLEPFQDYVTSDYLFKLFESKRISLIEKERITLVSFVRTINKLATVSNLITRKTSYDCNGIRINTFFIDNTTYNLYDKNNNKSLNNTVDLSICNLESPNTNTSTNKNHTSKNTSMSEVLRDNNNKQSISHFTTPIITPRRQAFNSLLHNTPDAIPPSPSTNHTHQQPFISKYPTLSKMGICQSYSDALLGITLNAVIRELETLASDIDIIYSRSNNTTAKPYFIPNQLSTFKSFDSWERRGKGIQSMLEFMSCNKTNVDTNEPCAVEFVTQRLRTLYPKTFNTVATKNGFWTKDRMNVIETAAALSDVAVGDKKIMSTLNRHLKCKLNGHDLFCPKRELALLTSRLPKLNFSRYMFEKEKGDRKELVDVAESNLIEAIQLDMDRYIETKCLPNTLYNCLDPKTPLFGYRTHRHNLGVYIFLGTDHGQGVAQFLTRLMFGDSVDRRKSGRADHGTRTISFATIKCRKDSYGILKMTSKETNESISILKRSQLVACIDVHNTVRTIFLPKDYTSYDISDGCITVTSTESTVTLPIPKGLSGNIRIKVLIKAFHILQVGDLAAQMTLQGREGMASCRCIKCNLTQNEWKSGMNYRLLKKEDLNSPGVNNIGQKLPMLWNICPSDTVVPLLHCQIGTVNDQLYKKLFRQILSIESGSQIELEKRLSVMDVNESIHQLEETKSFLDSNLTLYREEVMNERKDLVQKKQKIQYRKRRLQKTVMCNNDKQIEIAEFESMITSINKELKAIDHIIKARLADISSVDDTIFEETQNIEKLNSEVTVLQWERRNKELSIHTKIERVLEKNGITIQAYHGGTLTGVSIIALLNKHMLVMDEISKICHDAIKLREMDDLPLRPPTCDEFDIILNKHRRLFKAQDAVYAHLRLINPSTKEKEETRERISIMKHLWHDMELSETPKAHLIFEHAADDQERFNGLGDKIEDPLEKRHQEYIRLHSIFHKMHGGFELQMTTQSKIEWRNSNPLVMEQIEKVKNENKRKRKSSIFSLAKERNDVVKAERQETRRQQVDLLKSTLNV